MFSCVVGREGLCKQKSLFCVGGARSVWPTLDLLRPRWCVPPRSTLVRLLHSLKGYCPKWAWHFVHFPGLSRSGSRVLCKGTDPVGPGILCPPQVQAAQVTGCLANALSQVGRASSSPSQSRPLSFPDGPREHHLRHDVCLLWGADLRL